MPAFARCLTRVGTHVVRVTARLPVAAMQRTPCALGSQSSASGFLGNRSSLWPKMRSTERQFVVLAIKAQATATIEVGDKLPDAKFNYFDADGNMKEITTEELCAGKKVILFAVPGAFTPTCSLKHLPGFIAKADELKAAGVDTIACLGVNDAFVMDAWGKSIGAEDKVVMLADGSALFTKSIGVDLDLTDKGLGIRSRRYAMLVDDLVVKVMRLEEGGAFTLSSAEDILAELS